MAITEKRYFELRNQGNELSGTAIRYGDVASIAGIGRERFVAGCFGDLSSADVILNEQHDRNKPIARTGGGGLELIDTNTSLEIRANLNPEIAGKCLALVKSKVLRGLSVEFQTLKQRIEANTRIIERANLVGIGVVDKPAYANSIVQVRASGFSSYVPYGRPLSCQCAGGDCTHTILSGESFIDLDEIITARQKPNGDDITAAVEGYSDTVASLKNGSLRLSQDANGLTIEIPRLPSTQKVADMIEQSAVVGILARPYFQQTPEVKSEIEEIDGNLTQIVKGGADLRSIILGPSDKSGGWTPGEFVPIQDTRRKRWIY